MVREVDIPREGPLEAVKHYTVAGIQQTGSVSSSRLLVSSQAHIVEMPVVVEQFGAQVLSMVVMVGYDSVGNSKVVCLIILVGYTAGLEGLVVGVGFALRMIVTLGIANAG